MRPNTATLMDQAFGRRSEPGQGEQDQPAMRRED